MLQRQEYDGTRRDDALGAWYQGEAVARNRQNEELNLVEQMQENRKRDQDFAQAEKVNPLKVQEHMLNNAGKSTENETNQFKLDTTKSDEAMAKAGKVAQQASSIASMIAGLPSEELKWSAAEREYGRTPEGAKFFEALKQAKAQNLIPVGQDGSAASLSSLLEQISNKTLEQSKQYQTKMAELEAKATTAGMRERAITDRWAARDETNIEIANIKADAAAEAQRIKAAFVANGGKLQNMNGQQLWSYYHRMAQEGDAKQQARFGKLAMDTAETLLSWKGAQSQTEPRVVDKPGGGKTIGEVPKGRPIPPVRTPAYPEGVPSGQKIERTVNGKSATVVPPPPVDEPGVPRFTKKEDIKNMEVGKPFYWGNEKLYKYPNGMIGRTPPP